MKFLLLSMASAMGLLYVATGSLWYILPQYVALYGVVIVAAVEFDLSIRRNW